MINNNVQQALTYYEKNDDRLTREFKEFLRIPSVSTSDDHKEDIQRAAKFVADKLTAIGLKNVKTFSTARHPIVYGDLLVDHDKPTILVYGHYDVQPPDPIDEWETDPFKPQIRDEHLYARGASDMKGQVWAVISALQAIIGGSFLPVNIKLLIEGEEEIGSPSLDAFLKREKELLKCDLVLNPDGGMVAPNKPTIIYALRGLAYFELRVRGPKADLHSGIFGGVIANPANILSQVLAGMHDSKGRVTLPGFYDQVRELSEDEILELAKLNYNESFYKNITGAPALGGEMDYPPVVRVGARPTLDINGLYSGYIQQGAKTIIPAYAMAKLSMRLVPDQDPQIIHQSLEKYLKMHMPESVTWELDFLSGSPAYIAEEVPGTNIFSQALKETWGVAPVMKREGGSIPVATAMKAILGVDSIITGFGLPDDQIHSPNERLHLPTHKKGVEALIRFFLNF